MRLSEATEQATEAVYAAFSGVSKPAYIDGCPCCTAKDEYCTLLAKPLHELAEEDLAKYGAKALTTVGTVDDFRYLLPRLLDLSVHDDFAWPDPEVVFGKLRLADWRNWSTPERQAIEQLLIAIFEESLTAVSTDAEQVDTWLCAVACAAMPLQSFKERLETPEAASVLTALCELNEEALRNGKLRNAFWEENEPAMKEIINWFMSDGIRFRIRARRR